MLCPSNVRILPAPLEADKETLNAESDYKKYSNIRTLGQNNEAPQLANANCAGIVIREESSRRGSRLQRRPADRGRYTPLPYEGLVIFAIVLLNAVLGFVQEGHAESALSDISPEKSLALIGSAAAVKVGERRTVRAEALSIRET